MTKRKICHGGDVYEGTMKAFDVNGLRVLVANVDGKWYAVSDNCSHAGASLAVGELDAENCTVACLLHGAVFELTSGKSLEYPHTDAKPIATYPVSVEGDVVYIELD
jgi:3-phenylpropionate/trans-cinnamate dioxygenase ferredoxin subunit